MAQATEFGRRYVHPITGQIVPSVTTVIDAGIQKDLAKWAAKQSAQYAIDHWNSLSILSDEEKFKFISTAYEKTRNEASEKGDVVHESAEGFAKGVDDGNSPKHMAQLKKFFEVSQFEPVHTEVTLWDPDNEYAGTADLIARDRNGRYVLIDYKTGKGIWPEMAIQLEALSRCAVIIHPDGTEEKAPAIHTVGVLHLRPQSWWWHPIQNEEVRQKNFWTFLVALETHDNLGKIRNWKRQHPDMIWGNLGRFNEHNWPVKNPQANHS